MFFHIEDVIQFYRNAEHLSIRKNVLQKEFRKCVITQEPHLYESQKEQAWLLFLLLQAGPTNCVVEINDEFLFPFVEYMARLFGKQVRRAEKTEPLDLLFTEESSLFRLRNGGFFVGDLSDSEGGSMELLFEVGKSPVWKKITT